MGYKKNLVNPSLYRQFSNSPTEMFNYTMTNLMDSFYDSVMDESTDGSFKAVCLSGIRTEDNTGASEDANDAEQTLGYLTVVVRPLAPFGDTLPDPAGMTDPVSINGAISLHSTVFRARSDFQALQTDAPKFGQVLNCYYEQGSIGNSEFKSLRFSKFTTTEFDSRYKALATIEGVASMVDGDWNGASLLGTDTAAAAGEATKNGKSSNIQGDRTKPIEYIVIHYSAAGGSKKAVLKYENSKTKYGYHFMVDRDGSHFDSAPPDKIVWHAGGNATVKNSNSVGLCIMNLGYERDQVPAKSNWVSGKYPNANKQGKWEPYTQASLNKAATLCAQVLKDNNLTVDRIVGHSDIQRDKSDPGPAFDMAAFRQKVKSKMG